MLQVFSKQSKINLLVYTLLALHSVAYDQLLPVYMHCELSCRSNFAPTGFKSRGLRPVSAASALKADFVILVFVHKKKTLTSKSYRSGARKSYLRPKPVQIWRWLWHRRKLAIPQARSYSKTSHNNICFSSPIALAFCSCSTGSVACSSNS